MAHLRSEFAMKTVPGLVGRRLVPAATTLIAVTLLLTGERSAPHVRSVPPCNLSVSPYWAESWNSTNNYFSLAWTVQNQDVDNECVVTGGGITLSTPTGIVEVVSGPSPSSFTLGPFGSDYDSQLVTVNYHSLYTSGCGEANVSVVGFDGDPAVPVAVIENDCW
jgi:hypothetical protein